MSRIILLPESIKNKIAAGEVVEGPFSVAKELIENSIDAEATEVDVEVFENGLKKIAVKDNGTGIYKDDLPLTIQNHATSKIRDIADIERIASYGFRGEALASISSISRFAILSRRAEEDIGAKLASYNGETEVTAYAGASGTTIIVENLFYNIPARKKFLSSKAAELRRIREVFLKISLANPGISFSLSIDKKRIITLSRVNEIEERIAQIYGKSVSDNLCFERLKDLKVEVCGFLSKPGCLKSSRSMQIVYVNSRLIEYKYLGFLLSKAYQAMAPKGSYPAGIIFLTLDPELIDVNIHPAKKEVKFFDQSYINSLILRLAGKVLGKAHSLNIDRLNTSADANKHQMQNPGTNYPVNTTRTHEEELKFNNTNIIIQKEFIGTNFKKSNESYGAKDYAFRSFVKDTGKLYNKIEKPDDFKLLGIIFETYIIIERDNALSFIDFHAAHERYIYDAINSATRLETQSLIFPQVIELPVEDYQIFLEKKNYFIDIAFDIDIFSDNSIVVRGIPAIVKDLDIEGFLSDIIESLKHDEDHLQDIKKTIAEKAACHSAKRSGDSLSTEDAKIIAGRALNGDYEKRCPHGRPYIYNLEKNDLEKAFKRL